MRISDWSSDVCSSDLTRGARPCYGVARREKRNDVILDRFRLDDKVAVVTGAGRGLGAAMAVAFAEAGADVVIASRTQSQLAEVAEHVQAPGRKAHLVVADPAHPEAPAQPAGPGVEACGHLTIVRHNGGPTDERREGKKE